MSDSEWYNERALMGRKIIKDVRRKWNPSDEVRKAVNPDRAIAWGGRSCARVKQASAYFFLARLFSGPGCGVSARGKGA